MLLIIFVACVGTVEENAPSIEPSSSLQNDSIHEVELPQFVEMSPANEPTPSVEPSPNCDDKEVGKIEVILSNEPYSEEELYEIAEYLYQSVGVESYFLGIQTGTTRLIGKNCLIEIYRYPFEPYGTEYKYIFVDSFGSNDYLRLEEEYIMTALHYFSETKRADQMDAPTCFRGSIEEFMEIFENDRPMFGNISYVGQCNISFTYEDKPEYMYAFSHMDEVISMLKEEIKEEFIIYEGPITFDQYREDVDLCIIINDIKYYGHFRYFRYEKGTL
jgi:hypothetical protein